MGQLVDVDKVLKESMHGDSKETFGGNVPSERCYVIAAIARNIQFPGGNDGGALRSAQRQTGSAQFQSPRVNLFQDAPGAVSRRSVQYEFCAPPCSRNSSLPRSESQPGQPPRLGAGSEGTDPQPQEKQFEPI